jgi:hypothetical protein
VEWDRVDRADRADRADNIGGVKVDNKLRSNYKSESLKYQKGQTCAGL